MRRYQRDIVFGKKADSSLLRTPPVRSFTLYDILNKQFGTDNTNLRTLESTWITLNNHLQFLLAEVNNQKLLSEGFNAAVLRNQRLIEKRARIEEGEYSYSSPASRSS